METFNLRKQLLETRQELSTALYQHDAACRVILRLQKERDEAREALAKLSINGVTSKASDEMQVDNALPPLIEKLKQFNEQYASYTEARTNILEHERNARNVNFQKLMLPSMNYEHFTFNPNHNDFHRSTQQSHLIPKVGINLLSLDREDIGMLISMILQLENGKEIYLMSMATWLLM